MSNPESIRAAAYLATQQRLDFRRGSPTKTRRGKLNCTPGNKPCGSRCIPQSWDCRIRGEGRDNHTTATRTDPLAGVASIQRGAKDVARGVVTINPSRIERGRNSLIRGVVKLTPGDDIQKKKDLQRKLKEQTTPIAAVIAVSVLGLGVHTGLKRGFSSYRDGTGADIDRAAARAVDTVLDRFPGTAGPRAARRAVGQASVSEIATSAVRGAAIQRTQATTTGNLQRIGPLSFRPSAANYEASNLVNEFNALNTRARRGGLSYEEWQRSSVQALYGAQSPGTRGGGRRGSVYSEHAANEFLASKFGLGGLGAVGGQGAASMSVRNTLIEDQLSQRLSNWGQALRDDMRVRRITAPDGSIGNPEINRYIREVGLQGMERSLTSLSPELRQRVMSETVDRMRTVILTNPAGLRREARSIRRSLVAEYDTYFADVAQGMRRNAVASNSPFGDGMTGLARYVTRQSGQTTQVLSREHADLILRNHYHTRVMNLQSDFSVGENTARRIAQQLTRSPELPDTDTAYRVLNESGFPRAARNAARTGQRPQRPPTIAELTRQILARAEREGRTMSRAAAQRAARAELERSQQRRGDSESDLIRAATYLVARNDLKEGSRLGKPCGESYIPKAHECQKGRGASKQKLTQAVGTTALAAGVAAGATALALNPKLRQRARVEGHLLIKGSDKAIKQALLLGGRGTVANLSASQVKAGLNKLPEAFQGPARRLVGSAKQAAAAMALKAEGYSVQDIDVANNFSTWKNGKGTLISIGSYGDSLVTYASDNSHKWNGKSVYKIGFNVDQSYDATRAIPTEQSRTITSAVRKMTDNHLGKIKDGILATFPWDGDDYGAKRRAIYARAGFNNIPGEESQWALVQKGSIKKMSAHESFLYLAESGERDAPIYKPTKLERKDEALTKLPAHGPA